MKIVENRKKFFAASLIVIIIGFAAMIFNAQAGRGAFQYDVEFTGGTSFGRERRTAGFSSCMSLRFAYSKAFSRFPSALA